MPHKLAQKVLGHLGLTHEHGSSGSGSGPGAGPSAYPGAAAAATAPSSSGGGGGGGRWAVSPEEHALHRGGTYPRLCRLSDGSLLCVSTGFEGPVHVLQVSRSTDNGRTFSPRGEVARGAGDVDNGFLLELPPGADRRPGVVLAAFRNHDRGPATAQTDGKPFRHFRITVCRSEDAGLSWLYLAQAAEQNAVEQRGNGIWEPFMRIGRKGEVQLTYSGELARDDQETFRVDSFDGGATWSPPRCLWCHPRHENLRDGMQGIVSVQDAADGREALLMVFETTRRRPHFSVEYVVSYDEGRTWGGRGVVYAPRNPGRNAGSPQIARDARGRLAVVFQTDEDVDAPSWPGRAAVKATFLAAEDGLRGGRLGGGWSTPVLVSDVSSMWPGVFCTGDDEFMAVCGHAGKPVGRRLHWDA
ncbi:glycoside hydrolase family 93 protein [Xylariaceae sp. FL0804]|nr:glycoside hydrolase family 93 protein [Xylariaceae sp. FL0804]